MKILSILLILSLTACTTAQQKSSCNLLKYDKTLPEAQRADAISQCEFDFLYLQNLAERIKNGTDGK